jgi:RNA polymerase sigma-70 factor (ECF subfamily)
VRKPLRPKNQGLPSGQTTTEDLLAQVARGDRRAFSELYDRTARQVYGLVRRVVRDPTIAEEVSQEVFVEVWRTAPRFDPDRGAVLTWILTMAHRRAVDRVRSEEAARSRDDRVGRMETPNTEDVGSTVESRLEAERVRRALGGLSDIQREAIELAYYGGLTYREVAELLDVPLGTVKTRIRDGLIHLRDALEVAG